MSTTLNQIVNSLLDSNGMVLFTQNQLGHNGSEAPNVLPCRSALALTPWKLLRDRLLFEFLHAFHFQHSSPRSSLIFVSSVLEVNLVLKALEDRFPGAKIDGIGLNMDVVSLKAALLQQQSAPESPSLQLDVLVLSAPMALAAFVHGFLQAKSFSSWVFCDASGANQQHPFCFLMRHFYSESMRFSSALKIVGFASLPNGEAIEEDVFSRRHWRSKLLHYTQTFHCVPMVLGTLEQVDLVQRYLESFHQTSCFHDISGFYETHSGDPISSNLKGIEMTLQDSLDKVSFGSTIILKDSRPPMAELFRFLQKSRQSGAAKVIHHHQSPQLSAKVSLYALLHNIQLAQAATPNAAARTAAFTHDCRALLSQFEYLERMQQRDRVENCIMSLESGSLLTPLTAVSILIRACALLSRSCRQSASKRETIKMRTVRVFPVDEEGKRRQSHCAHLSLLRLPPFMWHKISDAAQDTKGASCTVSSDFQIQGPLENSRHRAQCAAAFLAARLLRDVGVLDENLLLAAEFRDRNGEEIEDAADTPDDAETEVTETPDEASVSFGEIIPEGLLMNPNTTELHIYALEYEITAAASANEGQEEEEIILTPYSRLLLAASPGIDCFSISRSNRTWSLALPRPLPSAILPVEIPIGSRHSLKTHLKPCGRLDVGSPEYRRLLRAQPTLFSTFNIRPIIRCHDSMNAPTMVPSDKQPFYLIAPMVKDEEACLLNLDVNDIPAVWLMFKEFVEKTTEAPISGAIYYPAADQAEKTVWKIDWKGLSEAAKTTSPATEPLPSSSPIRNLLSYLEALNQFLATLPTEQATMSLLMEARGTSIDFRRFALDRLVLLAPHSQIFYRVHRQPPEPLTPHSPVFSSSALPHLSTPAQYLQEKHQLTVTQDNQPLLSVRRLENWSDLAIWVSQDGASKHRQDSGRDNGLSSMLVPEFAEILPWPYIFVRMAMLIPRVSFEIERQLRCTEFFRSLEESKTSETEAGGSRDLDSAHSLALSAPLCPTRLAHPLQVESLTATAASLSYSYELLEVLGDSLLKYYTTLETLEAGVGWSEGRLSAHRQRLLCNANLKDIAEKLNLINYASFTPFFAKLWSPPALMRHYLDVELSQAEKALVASLFDPLDRWKALGQVEGKRRVKVETFHLHPNHQLTPITTQPSASSSVVYKYGQVVPAKTLADLVESLIGAFYCDGGAQRALQFLNLCGIIRPEIAQLSLRNPLELLLGTGSRVGFGDDGEWQERLRQRKTTLTDEIVSSKSAGATIPTTALVQNVGPYAPAFTDFPFEEVERRLGTDGPFKQRELLFMACTHSSLDSKLNNEHLEWVGDAALDWIVCRHYYRRWVVGEDGAENVQHGIRELNYETVATPSVLTAARQSTINNEALAKLAVRLGLYRFLRIDSPRLQLEVERFAKGVLEEEAADSAESRESNESGSMDLTTSALLQSDTHMATAAPKVIADFFKALVGAWLLDRNFNLEELDQMLIEHLASAELIPRHPSYTPCDAVQRVLHCYARLGIPRHQIRHTYRDITNQQKKETIRVVCQVWVRDQCVAEAEGSNRTAAKKLAMQRTLQLIEAEMAVDKWSCL